MSIESTYNSVSEYDGSIMPMAMEKGDFALLFSQDDGLDVVVLNSYNYVDNPDECHDVELLNKLLDVFYHNDEEFQHFSTNVPDDAVAMFTSEQSFAHTYAIIQDDEIICNANDAMTEYDIAINGVFNSSINDINSFSQVVNNFASQPGIYVEAKSEEHFLDYLNQHGIYTYSVDENGKLLCDNQMKRNPNFDFQSETEVDLQMEYTMQMGLHFTVAVDDSYYTIASGMIVKKYFKQDEFIRAFSDEDKSNRVLILNSAVFYKGMEINWPASDRFVKAVVDTANFPSTIETGNGVGTMVSAQTVYAGPSGSNYFTVGSVSASEVVYVLFKTVGWYYISYAVGQTGKTKMGFVPVQTVTIISSIEIPEKKFDGQFAYTNANVAVKSTDDVEYALDAGTIYAGEGFTYLYLADYSMVYVEFSTPSGTKRGYVPRAYIANINYTSTIGRVSSVSTGVYSGPDSSYVKLGGAYLNEYVCFLEEKDGWYLVEYNTPSGRKRGFSSVRDYEKQSYRNLPSSTNTSYLKKAIGSLTVYGGPNSNYANIGSIFDQEIVAQLGTEREYSYI